jgi:hypothetical protein
VTSEIACYRPERRSIAAPEVHVPVPVPVPVRSFSLPTFTPYSITIEGGMMDPISMHQNSEEQLPPMHASRAKLDPRMSIASSSKCRSEGVERHSQRRGSNEPISAAWAYTKYAMLFFIALLVTWVCYLFFRTRSTQFRSFASVASNLNYVMDRFPPRLTECMPWLGQTTFPSG